ncbi:TerB family tellurite resistance protein [Paraglaciecola chathamensis]|uniref:TerB family tellurite resistance protein n=1 Tax=Paraglaciecola chathamensis TaxID=368405 RepID=A0ABS0WI86_9ALTE|nr:TerB family tellurite resistance protein [Paraglaciecola chathamensis]MBJ2138200.1 TerB family tellurite resistance protein [Paraglaciecola chathamensis]
MLIKEVIKNVQNEGYYIGTWDSIDEATTIYIDTKTGVQDFYTLLNESDLECLPKIVNGTVANLEKSLVSVPLVIFKKSTPLNRQNSNVKYALLVGKIAAAMAKVDGNIDHEEIFQIREDIYKLSFLSDSEKYRVFIRSIYALQQNLSKDTIINSFALLSDKAKKQALNIAKDIAIADHHINRHERLFLYEFYRLCDLPTNTVDRDLKEHARTKNVVLENNSSKNVTVTDLIIEMDDSFDQMLSEFASF